MQIYLSRLVGVVIETFTEYHRSTKANKPKWAVSTGLTKKVASNWKNKRKRKEYSRHIQDVQISVQRKPQPIQERVRTVGYSAQGSVILFITPLAIILSDFSRP